MQKYLTIIAIIILSSNPVKSQNHKQFFLYPETYNPAFISNDKCSKILLLNTYQSLSSNANFIGNRLIGEIYMKNAGGIGLDISNYMSPSNVFIKQAIQFSYSQTIRVSRQNYISMSIGTKIDREIITDRELIFSSMLDQWDNLISPNQDPIGKLTAKQISFNAGAVYGNSTWYVSAIFDNLFPISAIFNTTKTFLIVQTQNKLFDENNSKVFINSTLRMNLETQNMMLGFRYKYSNFELEAAYQLNRAPGYLSNVYIFIAAIDFKRLKFAYSYSNTFIGIKTGISELSIELNFNCKQKVINNTINCPAY